MHFAVSRVYCISCCIGTLADIVYPVYAVDLLFAGASGIKDVAQLDAQSKFAMRLRLQQEILEKQHPDLTAGWSDTQDICATFALCVHEAHCLQLDTAEQVRQLQLLREMHGVLRERHAEAQRLQKAMDRQRQRIKSGLALLVKFQQRQQVLCSDHPEELGSKVPSAVLSSEQQDSVWTGALPWETDADSALTRLSVRIRATVNLRVRAVEERQLLAEEMERCKRNYAATVGAVAAAEACNLRRIDQLTDERAQLQAAASNNVHVDSACDRSQHTADKLDRELAQLRGRNMLLQQHRLRLQALLAKADKEFAVCLEMQARSNAGVGVEDAGMSREELMAGAVDAVIAEQAAAPREGGAVESAALLGLSDGVARPEEEAGGGEEEEGGGLLDELLEE